MPAQDEITHQPQQQSMPVTGPESQASSQQPRPAEPMTVSLRGGHDGEGEAICCGLCAGLCCFECCECCC